MSDDIITKNGLIRQEVLLVVAVRVMKGGFRYEENILSGIAGDHWAFSKAK